MSTRIMLMYKLFRKAMRQLHCAHCLQIAYVYAHQDSEARFSGNRLSQISITPHN